MGELTGGSNASFPSFQTPNGNVEAKVMCFYRRRDISSALVVLADKHQCKSSLVLVNPGAHQRMTEGPPSSRIQFIYNSDNISSSFKPFKIKISIGCRACK